MEHILSRPPQAARAVQHDNRIRDTIHGPAKRDRSNRLVLGILCLLLGSCARQNPAPKIVEVTRIVEATPAAIPQITPAPNAAHMLFPVECLTPEPGVDYSPYSMYNIDTIGWCSFVRPSPDGRYLAYSTMTCMSGPTPGVCGEVVKVLEVNSDESRVAHFIEQGSKRLVDGLQWSATGDLVIIRTDIDQAVDTWVVSWPPASTKLATKAIIQGGLKQWNSPRTAFYTFVGAGPGGCGGIVSGYDFTSQKPFPDIAAILGLDSMRAEVYGDTWWDGESSILLSITPMKYDEERQDDKFLPTIAGKITLTASGPEFTTLASSPTQDFYFVRSEEKGYLITAKPYQVRYCLETLSPGN